MVLVLELLAFPNQKMKPYKTYVVSELPGSGQYGTTPRQQDVGLTKTLFHGESRTFTPMQRMATRGAVTQLQEHRLQMKMWVITENPRLASVFGNESVPDVKLPETVELMCATTEDSDQWQENTCRIMSGRLVLPKFETYPMFVKFDVEIPE